MVCRNRHNKVVQEKKVSKPTAVFLLLGFLCVAGVLYIFQVNRLATMGYEIKNKEKAIEELKKSNESLKIRAAELKSMHNLETEKERMQMKKPGEVSYIEVGTPVALR